LSPFWTFLPYPSLPYTRPFELSSPSISFLHATLELSSHIRFFSTHGSSSPRLNSSSPFRLLSTHKLGSPKPNSQSPSISSLCTSQVPLTWFLVPFSSPFYTRVESPPTQFLVPLSSPLCMGWVLLRPILSPPSFSFPCTNRVPPDLIPVHLSMLQVHGSQHEALVCAWMSYKYGRA
jgi:hypothetical protein